MLDSLEDLNKSTLPGTSQVPFNQPEISIEEIGSKKIHVFQAGEQNMDKTTVESFGEEWTKFGNFSEEEISSTGVMYFVFIVLGSFNISNVVYVGCGSGSCM